MKNWLSWITGLNGVKSELGEIREELSEVKDDVTNIKSELSVVRDDLAEIKTQLDSVWEQTAISTEFKTGTGSIY